MSDVSGATPGDAPKGLWARYRSSALWVRIVIPLAVVILLTGIIAVIANASNDSSTSDQREKAILLAVAKRLAEEEAATTTSTTEATSTTEQATTTAATTTTEEASTTTAAATSAPPPVTTAAPVTTEPPTTGAPTTEAPTTEGPTTEGPTTEGPSPPTSELPLPPGQVATSPEAFRVAWNAAAAGTSVPMITSWSQEPLAGHTGSIADLGGNVRLVLLSDSDTSPVSEAVLVWLPLSDPSEQPVQNQAYRDAFNVMMKTVKPTVTSDEQTTVATALGLDGDHPPFDTGTTKNTTLRPQEYRLEAILTTGASEPDTLIGVTSSLPR